MASPKPVIAPKPAATKAPAVIAKPSAPAPATKSSGAAPKGGGQAASGTKLSGGFGGSGFANLPKVTPNPSGQSSGKSSNQSAIDKALAGIKSDFEKLKELGKTLTGGTTVVSGGDDTGGGEKEGGSGGGEDPSLAYAKMQDEKAKRNAFALLKDVFTQYGLSELATTIETLMKEGYEPEEATLALKTDVRYNAPYIKRFRGKK